MIRNQSLKRRMLAASVLGALVVLPVTQPALGGHATPLEKSLRKKINAYRAEKGKAKLKMKDILVTKARAQAEDMAADGEFDPVGDHSSEKQLTSYAKAAGCDTAPFISEIIASEVSLDRMMDGWKASTPHRKTILKKGWERIGTGVVEAHGKLWAVVLFCSTK